MALEILTPAMTSNTTPSGVVSADLCKINLNPDPDSAYLLFSLQDASSVPPWSTSLGGFFVPYAPPHWVEYDFGPGADATCAAFQIYAGYNYPTDFKLQGWDGAAWVDLESVTGSIVQEGWTDIIHVSAPTAYQKYRLYVSAFWAPAGEGTPDDTVHISSVLLWSSTAETAVPFPSQSLPFTPAAPAVLTGEVFDAPALVQQSFLPAAPGIEVGPVSLVMPAAEELITPGPVAVSFTPNPELRTSRVYRVTLTGAGEDFVVPVSSINMRLRNGKPSYVLIVVPADAATVAEVNARADGRLIIERGVRFGDGSMQLVPLLNAAIDSLRDDVGGKNRSLSIIGYGAVTNTAPKLVTLTDVSYINSGGESTRVRANLDLNLRPGDTAVLEDRSIVVTMVSCLVSKDLEVLEIEGNE